MRKMTIIECTEEVMKFTLPCEDGGVKEFDTLTTFELENGKDYILFTDNTVNEEGRIKLFPAIFHEDRMEIEDITSDEEFAKIQTVVEEIREMLIGEEFDSELFGDE